MMNIIQETKDAHRETELAWDVTETVEDKRNASPPYKAATYNVISKQTKAMTE